MAREHRKVVEAATERRSRRKERGGLTGFLSTVATARTYLGLLAVVGGGIVFIVPAIWALSITGSVDEAAMILEVRDPISLATSALPALIQSLFVGVVVAAAVLGVCALPLHKVSDMEQATRRQLWWVAGLSLTFALCLVVAGEAVPWAPAHAAAGVAQLGVLPPLWASVRLLSLDAKSGEFARIMAVGTPLLLALALMGWGLQPLPRASLDIVGEEPVVGYIVEQDQNLVLLVPDPSPGATRSSTYDIVTVPAASVRVSVCDRSIYYVGSGC